MAIEQRRGCGYRKVGGTYLVSAGATVHCDRLPLRLDVCPVCSHGFKQARGWTWVQLLGLVGGPHRVLRNHPMTEERYADTCDCFAACPLCRNPEAIGRAGLIWIGEKFYKNPAEFMIEGRELGFSRRIQAIPRGFKIGETWVMLAHPKTIHTFEDVKNDQLELSEAPVAPVERTEKWLPGIFTLWCPTRIERLFVESQRDSDEVKNAIEQGITPVFVPDNDPDHQGTVYDVPEHEDVAEPTAA